MNTINSKSVVLVTGASSGLGARTAELLAAQGHHVVGAARRTAEVAALPGVEPLALDLTDHASITAAVEHVLARHGRVDVLVNAAGYGEFGSVEETTPERARRQLDVNVFGLAALTQQVLGPMRAAGRGRVVNVSSLAGEFSSPLAGWYHASKFAVEALSDSLRHEVRPFGIDVVVVQPGPVRTPWHDQALTSMQETSGAGPYAGMARAVREFHERAQDQPITSDVDTVADVIVTAATTSRPRVRYRPGRGAALAVALSRLPDRVFDALTRRQFRLP